MPFLPPNCMVHDCLFIYIAAGHHIWQISTQTSLYLIRTCSQINSSQLNEHLWTQVTNINQNVCIYLTQLNTNTYFSHSDQVSREIVPDSSTRIDENSESCGQRKSSQSLAYETTLVPNITVLTKFSHTHAKLLSNSTICEHFYAKRAHSGYLSHCSYGNRRANNQYSMRNHE